MVTDWNAILIGCIELVAILTALMFIGNGVMKFQKKAFDENAKGILEKIDQQHEDFTKEVQQVKTDVKLYVDQLVTRYDRNFTDHNRRLTELETTSKETDLTCRRTELLMMFHMTPERVDVILSRYDAYKRRGGNTYIDDLYKEWHKKYAQNRIADIIPGPDQDVVEVKPKSKPRTPSKRTTKSKTQTKPKSQDTTDCQ